ncbi:MAG TPA: hypothetical protein PKO23_05965 [Candidatus Hydrogenedentes bacterium]|jgi:hypothetical protein|nr:hypothetical protein [Candidatus Hydrogenedentota bacterium]
MTTDPHQRSRTRTPWQGRQRRILLIAGVVLLCPFVVFFTAKYYSDRHYAARLEAIRAEGGPATLEELIRWKKRPPVPDDLQEGEPGTDEPSGEDPPITPEGSPENTSETPERTSAGLQTQVSEGLEALYKGPDEEEVMDILVRLHKEGIISPEDQEKLRVHLEKYGDLLELLHEAALLPPGGYSLDYSKGFEMELPHLAKTRCAVRLLQAAATYAALVGDVDGAFHALTTAMAIPRPLQQEDLLISFLVRKACSDIALATLAETLGRITYTDAQLSHFQRFFASEYDPEALANAFITERVFGFEAFNDPARFMNARINWLEEVLPGASLTVVRTANAFGWFTQDRDYYLDSMERLIQAARMPYAEARNAFPDLEAGGGSVLTSLSDILLPALGRVIEANAAYETRLDQGAVAAAIERYRVAQGAPPDHLEALVPGYLDKVPPDPYDEQPLRYRREGEGYVIYSIGDNLADEGGTESPRSSREGDLVFRVHR